MKVVIAGAFGNLGAEILKKVCSDGHEVVAADLKEGSVEGTEGKYTFVRIDATKPEITTQCLRVPVSDGHTAAVFVSFDKKPTIDEIKTAWKEFAGEPQQKGLPSAPKQFINLGFASI